MEVLLNYYNNPINTDVPPQGNQPYFYNRQEQPMSVGDWMITMLIMVIPLVNIIMLFVWAFGSDTQETKKNWAKASLIWMAIGIVFWIIAFGTIVSMFMSAGGDLPTTY